MNKFIKVGYSLYTISEEGKQELVERTSANQPFQFISGLGMVLDAFEEQVAELEAEEEFNFVIPCERAYGAYTEEHVISMPRETFSIDGHFDADHIYPGAEIPLVNEDGMRFDGIVKAVDSEKVTIDLNHPLAGQTLQFKGRIVETRPATAEELQGALNRMSGEECGCGCGGHCEDKHEGGHCGCGHCH
ncbi:MAG: FKBP-type peptidyl-prolyl cis-trans isomerase [Alloprevotella sp.]|nr:FKBP-type peptidyl-prolyl cis-trans isomerase [Alloprevotella sp.]